MQKIGGEMFMIPGMILILEMGFLLTRKNFDFFSNRIKPYIEKNNKYSTYSN